MVTRLLGVLVLDMMRILDKSANNVYLIPWPASAGISTILSVRGCMLDTLFLVVAVWAPTWNSSRALRVVGAKRKEGHTVCDAN